MNTRIEKICHMLGRIDRSNVTYKFDELEDIDFTVDKNFTDNPIIVSMSGSLLDSLDDETIVSDLSHDIMSARIGRYFDNEY